MIKAKLENFEDSWNSLEKVLKKYWENYIKIMKTYEKFTKTCEIEEILKRFVKSDGKIFHAIYEFQNIKVLRVKFKARYFKEFWGYF